MKIRLELAHKKTKVKKVTLTADTIIGRSSDCGLRIASNEVSRQHCKICIGEDGVMVRDLGSSNGTFVNGYQLEPDTDYEIAPDSELSLGGIKFFVRFTELPEKVMQTDGLGSTVDLKPGQKQQLAALEKSPREAEPDEDEMHFSEAPESDEESPAEEEAAEPESADGPEENENATVQRVRPLEADPVMEDAEEEAEFEMSTHGDSAVLEREENESETEAEASAESEEVVDLEFDEPEIREEAQKTAAEEVVDLEREEDSEEAEADDVLDGEIEEEEREGEADLEQTEEPAAVAEDEEILPEPADEEMSENDVAAFLNQVSDEDQETDNEGDGSLGDFFKQFD